ncbi:MAG: hypothetical protein IJ036_04830 [Lachnospiraceae bacterium]|nr:hypothetical protein [Lachnospiraceae bacterium]
MKDSARDPYKSWKVLAMTLAAAVVVLCLAALLLNTGTYIVLAALVLGAVMCTVSGIMALVKGRKALGYLCSVLAGAFLVLLLIWIVRIFWLRG